MRSLLPLVLLACTAGDAFDPATVRVVFDPSTEAFFDTPWPSDARRTAEGTPDWSTFPDPVDVALFDTFLDVAGRRPGFALNAPAYLQFAGPIDTDRLPDAYGSVEPDSPLQLVDVTPGSPTYGERTPLWWEVRETEGAYVTEHLLAVAPVPGWPLRPRTTYALLATTELAARNTRFHALADQTGPWADVYALVASAAPSVGVPLDRVALATTFTTGDPTAELDVIAEVLDTRVAPPAFTTGLEHLYDLGAYRVFRSGYATPRWMTGDKPYALEGGPFAFRADGLPQVQGWDLMRMSVVVPERGAAPADGWPVVVYLHGTGGDYRTFCNSDSELEVGQWLAEAGAVGIGIDLPLHGTRGTPDTNLSLHSFNVLQPESALHIHRQAATDLLYLVKGLTDGPVTFTDDAGASVPLDPSRVVVMGHSQGGITASLALPWLGGRVAGTVLSGAGGLLAITAVERDADFDFPGLIRDTLGFESDEELTELHPILGLVQSIVEPTDPINYARYWLHEDGGLYGQAPTPVLLTTGLGDLQTPTRTAEALASAARIPFVGRRETDAPGMALRGLDGARFPQEGNVAAFDGSEVTAGFSQWKDGDHFVVFDDPDARDLVRNFVVTALNGRPRLKKGAPPPLR